MRYPGKYAKPFALLHFCWLESTASRKLYHDPARVGSWHQVDVSKHNSFSATLQKHSTGLLVFNMGLLGSKTQFSCQCLHQLSTRVSTAPVKSRDKGIWSKHSGKFFALQPHQLQAALHSRYHSTTQVALHLPALGKRYISFPYTIQIKSSVIPHMNPSDGRFTVASRQVGMAAQPLIQHRMHTGPQHTLKLI